jgi:lipopolysaccharide/colanic/teichoic acid biosynthesis glycosyltransferase
MIERYSSMFYQIIKRVMDIIFAIMGLLILAVVFLPIAVAVKIDSPGSVFFMQLRLGKDLKLFNCFKFRTMYSNSGISGQKPESNDERVTRVGRFLRRSSLDELPQCINILRNEMSLVGPRPEQQQFLIHYTDWQRRRFIVKPGLTGWWQVNGRKQPMYDYIDEDLFYVEHCSIWLDLKIIWRSIRAVLSGDGAV